MTVIPDDIRAAVANGTISETQAVGILALAEARKGYRQNTADIDEPFELFRGFNEIFIVVGLSILFSGALGIVFAFGALSSQAASIIGMGLVLVGLYFLSVYFTARRRMVAPSIALTIMVTISAAAFGASTKLTLAQAGAWDWGIPNLANVVFVTCLLVLTFYWIKFRVPFAVACIAVSIYGLCFTLLTQQGAQLDSVENIFLLSGSGPFAWLTIALGLAGFIIAMYFDLSDPHRVTRRSAQAFWLHVISATAIVNPIAVSLLYIGSPFAFAALTVFLVVMGGLAIIIDRRSFLLSALTYIVTLGFVLTGDSQGSSLIFFAIGVVLVSLGAFWEKWRQALLQALPDFPGKDQLPPWRIAQ